MQYKEKELYNIQKERTWTHNLNLTSLQFNQYSQYVQSVYVVLLKPVLNSVSLIMYYMCTI